MNPYVFPWGCGCPTEPSVSHLCMSQGAIYVPWICMCPLELGPIDVPWSHPHSADPEVSPGAADVQEAIHIPPTISHNGCSTEPFTPLVCPLRGAAVAAATPEAPFWCSPLESTQSPTSVLAIPGWFLRQPCSRLLFMAHPDPLQSGCFAVWLNRLWLQPWEEGPCPPCDYTPALTTRMETRGTRGHTQTHPTAPCSHGNWVPRPRVPSPVWPLPKAGQPGPMPRLIQPANPPEAHVRGHTWPEWGQDVAPGGQDVALEAGWHPPDWGC